VSKGVNKGHFLAVSVFNHTSKPVRRRKARKIGQTSESDSEGRVGGWRTVLMLVCTVNSREFDELFAMPPITLRPGLYEPATAAIVCDKETSAPIFLDGCIVWVAVILCVSGSSTPLITLSNFMCFECANFTAANFFLLYASGRRERTGRDEYRRSRHEGCLYFNLTSLSSHF
jgi:hypothetical protein